MLLVEEVCSLESPIAVHEEVHRFPGVPPDVRELLIG